MTASSRRVLRRIGWILLAAAVLVALAAVTATRLFRSDWGQNQVRQAILTQANRLLTGTLEIDWIGGSWLRGVELRGVRLVQGGVPVVSVGTVTVDYSLRELYAGGTAIRFLKLQGLHIVGQKDSEGRWNLGRLLRPRPPLAPGGSPPRRVALDRIEIVDGSVELRDPVSLGAARVPARFDRVSAVFRVDWQGPSWHFQFDRAAWVGRTPDLEVGRLAGGLAFDAAGWTFDALRVETPRSAFTLNGAVRREPEPTRLDLLVDAERFAFQEWAGMVTGLRNIAVESTFSARLAGPTNRLETTIDLRSTGGSVAGSFDLDSTVPGWHGAGEATVARLDLSKWFNRPDRPSDITGRVTFDLDLDLGRRFPRGSFAFDGAHASYLGYAADHVRARGRLTEREAVIATATATAYGADLRVSTGAIAIDAPYPYRFSGRAAGVDLRRLPRDVPVPHVESTLALAYSVSGQFAPGRFRGSAVFEPSRFLAARIEAGATGMVDASVSPVQYRGEGRISELSVRRFGDDLDVAWMRDPRYDGVLDGQFSVSGTGSTAAALVLEARGRLHRATLFDGVLGPADVSVRIEGGALRASYDGAFEGVNVARAANDPRLAAMVSGSGQGSIAVDGLLVRATALGDYTVDATATLTSSTVRDLAVDRAVVGARLADGSLRIARLEVAGPRLEASGQGTVELDGRRSSAFDYEVLRADLAWLASSLRRPVSGTLTAQGRATGPLTALRVQGTARVSRAEAASVEVLGGGLDYDATIPTDRPFEAVGRVSAALGPLAVAGQAINQVTAAGTYDRGSVGFEIRGTRAGGLNGTLTAAIRIDPDGRTADVARLRVQLQGMAWRLAEGALPHLAWDGDGVDVRDLQLVDEDGGRQRVEVSGAWRPSTADALRIRARGVFLDPIIGAMSQPARLGGRVDADLAVRAATSAGQLRVSGTVVVLEGRIQRLPFERASATIALADGVMEIDGRLDQAPGVWFTALGTVPLGLFIDGQPDQPLRVALASSPVDLGILEGVTDIVHEVSGGLQLNVTVLGSGRDPHFDGTVEVTNGAFRVRATGAQYRNARLSVQLASDLVTVKALHVDDARGHGLDVTGSLGTHELRVGNLAVTARARQFEVMRNEFGSTQVDADLDLRGEFESPRLSGTIAITGGALNVDEILDRALFRPYATQAAAAPTVQPGITVDPLAVLNPWERMGVDLAIQSRGTLRLLGENVQVSAGTPLGLGDVNVRAFGDIYLYKDPAQPLFVTGSLDSLVGTYAFQGRRFDLDPGSSVVFRGDLNPELYVTVERTISGVVARVSIVGPLNEPALQLSSTPRLDDSNILSLIVFNTNVNELNSAQQQELAVRAGTLAAGFLATPLVSALERSLGLDILEIELSPSTTPGAAVPAPRVTVGDEIAPGLVARFSRQFGPQEYSEASLEYFLSRLFRIRATFSDAGSVLARSPFRRVERAGIDFLVFFSF